MPLVPSLVLISDKLCFVSLIIMLVYFQYSNTSNPPRITTQQCLIAVFRVFNANGLAEKSIKFPVSPPYAAAVPKGTTGAKGDRVTKLGLNM